MVLDRSLSARPIQMLRDSDSASTLAITASMLAENLLLRLRRQRAQKFALTDPLTRLFNRRMGITSLDQEIARAHRSGHPMTVLMIDLDDFKKLNDVHGHVQGDHALRAIAEVLRKTLRKSDTICRYGGEEFLVVLPETTAEEASILAARLFTAAEARGREMQLPITVSIGQASIRAEDTVESLLQRADKALYASKSQGRNRFSVDADLE
jgi:diguanylate cyclase (GGDEF)-like protein